MRGVRWFRAGAVTVVAGSLVVSCSGSDPSGDDIAGVDAGVQEAGSDGAEGADGADDGVERPDIELPDDLHSVFEDPSLDDPVKQAVLDDQRRQIDALDEAITSGELDRPALPFYTADRALASDIDFALTFHEDGHSIAGTNRYYNRTVEIVEDDRATASYCMDPSEAYTYDTASGEEFPNADARLHYSAVLELNEVGVWQTVMYFQDEEPDEC